MGEINVEYRALLPDGGLRWITLRGRVVPDILGQPARVLGAAYDRSRERELSKSLQVASERLQVLASAGAALSASLSPHDVLDVLTRVLVPEQAASLVLAVTPAAAELLKADLGLPANLEVREAIAGDLSEGDARMAEFMAGIEDTIVDGNPAPPIGAGGVVDIGSRVADRLAFGDITPQEAAREFMTEVERSIGAS